MNKSNIEAAMQWEAEKYYTANKNKNKASTEERKALRELNVLLSQANDGEYYSLEHTFEYEDNPVTLAISYQQDTKDTIDIQKLFEIVDKDTFLRIVTASRASVEKEAGKNIANRCVIGKVTDFKAKVKEKK